MCFLSHVFSVANGGVFFLTSSPSPLLLFAHTSQQRARPREQQAGLNSTDIDLQTVTIHNVQHKDAGIYSCMAGNSIGFSELQAWLTVKGEKKQRLRPEPDCVHTLW